MFPKDRRFASVSELGLREADFNAVVEIKKSHTPLSIYVSVKNRSNTIGGPDWPNAIQALEALAISDKNRRGPYICIFAFVMESGGRSVKRTKDKSLRSPNTELWLQIISGLSLQITHMRKLCRQFYEF